MSVEKYIEVLNFDPNLLGRNFCCSGAKNITPSVKHPADCGETVGLEISFVTWNINKDIVEDRSTSDFRGCVFHTTGLCTKFSDKLACPVSGVVSVADYRKRIEELKKLEKGNPNKRK